MKHDEHYRQIEESGRPQPIDVEEYLISGLIKAGISPEKALDLVMGVKHIQRAGVKLGEDWHKEIDKTTNYFVRGLTGNWIQDAVFDEPKEGPETELEQRLRDVRSRNFTFTEHGNLGKYHCFNIHKTKRVERDTHNIGCSGCSFQLISGGCQMYLSPDIDCLGGSWVEINK